ncbi:hypothetical protein BC828DRAFT_399877 [Blastocladiella britannica]|nr:hypothetical protein BC828DRAFT_399877 [Blastocladiella britannica]
MDRPQKSRIPFSLLVLCATIAVLLHSAAAHASPIGRYHNPRGDTICNPLDPADCYARDFAPAVDYKPVRPGQELPPGLDIRMDWQTGETWAKVPASSQDAPPHADNNGAVVVVDAPGAEEPENQEQEQRVAFRHASAAPGGSDNKVPVASPHAAAPVSGGKRRVPHAEVSTVAALANRLVRATSESPLSRGEWESLEEMSHQVDHGTDLAEHLADHIEQVAQTARNGGIDHAVLFYRMLGNIHQNNAKSLTKTAANKHVPEILQHLMLCAESTGSTGSVRVAKSCMYALGSLVRGHGDLKAEFTVRMDGVARLARLGQTSQPLRQKCDDLMDDLTSLALDDQLQQL